MSLFGQDSEVMTGNKAEKRWGSANDRGSHLNPGGWDAASCTTAHLETPFLNPPIIFGVNLTPFNF